jgi:hypothetical protein
MKGKKSDPEFVAEFIQKSAQAGITQPIQIVNKAKQLIQEIDQEIIAIESRKKIRSKLLDVIDALEEKEKLDNLESKLLSFFDFKYPSFCKEICLMLKEKNNFVPSKSYGSYDLEVKFCIKQLLETNIIKRIDDHFEKDNRFDEYVTFVLRDNK